MKTPVVSFNTGGVSEAVINNETGMIVNELNSCALADALIELLSNNELRERFAMAGREHIINNFNVVTQGEKLATLYRTTINQYQL